MSNAKIITNFYPAIEDALLHGWVDYHAIQPTHIERHPNRTLILLDDGRQIIVVGFDESTVVNIVSMHAKGGHMFIIGREEDVQNFVRFLSTY